MHAKKLWRTGACFFRKLWSATTKPTCDAALRSLARIATTLFFAWATWICDVSVRKGQQRLAVLALKVALARWVEQVTHEPPILLLDDALSELDATRRERLLTQAAAFSQSVLTATDLKLLESASPTLFQVEAGRVQPA
jgi:hypothetical protein